MNMYLYMYIWSFVVPWLGFV